MSTVRAIGFLGGQFGDAIMCQVAAQRFKELAPNSHLTFAVAEKYKSVLPFLYKNKSIDATHIWEGYDSAWPTQNDLKFIQDNNTHITYNAMAKHVDEDWYLKRHQTEEICAMFNLGTPSSTQINLERYFPVQNMQNNTVAICPFAVTRGSEKSLTPERVLEIESAIKKNGFNAVQVCAPNDPKICEHSISTDIFSAIQEILSYKMVICVDTSIAWILSGYRHPVIGLYNSSYYFGAPSCKNWQPTNDNAIYLENTNDVNKISLDEICAAIHEVN